MAMRFAQDVSGMDGSMSSPSSPVSQISPVQRNTGGKSFMGRGGQPMLSQSQNYLNQSPYGGQAMQSQPMFTGAPSGGGGALGQLSNMQAQTPPNPQRMAQMLRGAGRLFGRF